MSQLDPWEKAADCERALRITVDPIQRDILSNIREFWIALANERPFLSEEDLEAGIAVISDFPRHARPQHSRVAHVPLKACWTLLNGFRGRHRPRKALGRERRRRSLPYRRLAILTYPRAQSSTPPMRRVARV
jgi:hypothetical protein